MVLLVLSVVPPLLATGMPSSDDRARGSVSRNGSDCGSGCRTLSPIGRTLAVLLFLGVLLLLGLLLLLVLLLLLGLIRLRLP